MRPIKLVLFDALHTIITPRLPIHVQYAQALQPYVGQLEPLRIKSGFQKALRQLQKDKPAYLGGVNAWWAEVIRRTALDAGADVHELESSLDVIVPQLMQRFSGREGYKVFDDTLPTLQLLNSRGIQTGLLSNADARLRSIINDMGLSQFLHPIVISEEEGIEKPNPTIWSRALSRAGHGVQPHEAVHVGDELAADYHGAVAAGLHAFLLRRSGGDGDGEHKEDSENLANIQVVKTLYEVAQMILDTTNEE